jgi:hypothetical protein
VKRGRRAVERILENVARTQADERAHKSKLFSFSGLERVRFAPKRNTQKPEPRGVPSPFSAVSQSLLPMKSMLITRQSVVGRWRSVVGELLS